MTMASKRMTRNQWLPAILILLAAAGLRLTALDRQALWGDEACMVYLCQEPSTAIVDALASADRPDVDVAPPLYFLLLHGWMRLLGTSLWAFRGFSVMFGVLTVLCVMGLGRRMFTPGIGLLAGALAAIHPFQVWYSQEGRMYAMAACLAAAAMWGLAAAMAAPGKKGGWLAFGAAGLALIYTQYYGALLLAAMVLFVLSRVRMDADYRRERCRGLTGVVLVWTAAFAPWLPVLVTDYRHAGAPGGFPLMFHWLKTPVFLFLKMVLFGNQNYVMDHWWLYPLPLLAGTIVLIAALRSIRDHRIQLLTWALLFPFAVVFILSLSGMRVYKSHPFIIFHPALIVLLAYGLAQLKPRAGRISAALIGAAQVIILVTLVLGGDYVKPRNHDVANWIEHREGPDAVVSVIPAFIPNPMPIVGDLLAFRYHSGQRFKTSYLTGSTAGDIVQAIIAQGGDAAGIAPDVRGTDPDTRGTAPDARGTHRMYIVCQLNPQVVPYLNRIFSVLDTRWVRLEEKEFPSRIRGFSMKVVAYEIHGL